MDCPLHPDGPVSGLKRRGHPVVQVAWEDAAACAKWAGKPAGGALAAGPQRERAPLDSITTPGRLALRFFFTSQLGFTMAFQQNTGEAKTLPADGH